jgi:GT2 family glycosyltransferase
MGVLSPDNIPSVAVVVLNWNGTEDTLGCLGSLARLNYPRCEIIVVDNGSQRSPRVRVAEQFPSVTYIETGLNLGYAGGNNVGIRHALAAGHDYVFVLNNDTEVESELLRHAVGVAESDPRIAVVGVKIISWDDRTRVWVAYGRLTYRQGLVHLVGYLKPDNGAFDEQSDVPWVPGTAMLLRRRALEAIGPFDDGYFAYHEDVDWCTQAHEQGWRVVFAPGPPGARVVHKGHRSSGGKGYVTPRQYLAGRNMVRFVLKHARWYQCLQFLLFQVTTLPLQYLRRCLTGEQRGVVLKVRGMLDALRGRPLPLEELGLR